METAKTGVNHHSIEESYEGRLFFELSSVSLLARVGSHSTLSGFHISSSAACLSEFHSLRLRLLTLLNLEGKKTQNNPEGSFHLYL